MRLRSTAIESMLAFLLILPVLAPVAAHANLLVNGRFEDGDEIEFSEGFFAILGAGSSELPGWVVTRDTIDYVSASLYQNGEDLAASGDRSIDLDGTPGFGGIAQAFATTPGQPYRVSFALAGNADGRFTPSEPDVKFLRVLAAGTSADFSVDVTGHTPRTWAGFRGRGRSPRSTR